MGRAPLTAMGRSALNMVALSDSLVIGSEILASMREAAVAGGGTVACTYETAFGSFIVTILGPLSADQAEAILNEFERKKNERAKQ